MDNPHTIVFVIDGEIDQKKIRPGNLPLKDVAYVLEQFAIAVNALASEDSAEQLQAPVPLSLVAINEGSGRYQIQSDRRGNRHAGQIINALTHRDASLLGPRARAAVNKIHGRAKKSGWSAYSIESHRKAGVKKVKVTPSEKLFDRPLVFGSTVLLAFVNKVGGDIGRGRAEIHLHDKRKINAKVKTKELAETLGHLLYRTVELHGFGSYNSETLQLSEFEIRGIGSFAGTDPIEAIEQLSALDSERWGGVDVVNHVESYRNESGDE